MKEWLAYLRSERGILLVVAGCYLVVAMLSLVPETYRPHLPGISDTVEHILAYSLLGLLTAHFLADRISAPLLFGGIVAYAGLLEIGQTFVPCRQASAFDLAASAIGALIGLTLASLLRTQRA